MFDSNVPSTPSHSSEIGESLFPLEFYYQVQDMIDSLFVFPRSVEQVVDIKQVLSLFSQFLYMNYGRLYLFDRNKNRLSLRMGQSFNQERLSLGQYELGEGITGSAYLNKQVQYVRDIDVEPQYLGRNYTSKDLPYSQAGYLAVPFYGEKESGVLGFHLGRRSMIDIYHSVAIAFGIGEKIGEGTLRLTVEL